MRETDLENHISCVVDYGTIYNKRDMIRVLRDLDKVLYYDLIDNALASSGNGYVIEVYSNSFDSTVIFNHRLHINVNGFDYLKIKTSPKKEISLISGHRTVRLEPLNFPKEQELQEDIDEQRLATFSQLACDNENELNYYSD